MRKMVLSLLVRNEAGVTSRISALFTRRGYSMESITGGATEDEKISRLTVVVSGADDVLEQVTKQLDKLDDVIKIVTACDATLTIITKDGTVIPLTLADLEDNIMQMIENKVQVPDEYFALVDDISLAVFDGLGIEYYGITDIFYDVAIELGLIEEDDEDYYDIFDQLS